MSPANVRQLRPVATFDVGEPLNFQTGPVVIGGTRYLTTYKDTYAIDAASGSLKWKAPAPRGGLAMTDGESHQHQSGTIGARRSRRSSFP